MILASDANQRIRFAGHLWVARQTAVNYSRGATSIDSTLHHIPRRSTNMTEAWTGRKYRGNLTDGTYDIISEPFEHAGVRWVVYAFKGSAALNVARINELEGGDFTRIREPKFAVGDRVTNGYDSGSVEAVSARPDADGDFAYLVRQDDDLYETAYEAEWEKVGQ